MYDHWTLDIGEGFFYFFFTFLYRSNVFTTLSTNYTAIRKGKAWPCVGFGLNGLGHLAVHLHIWFIWFLFWTSTQCSVFAFIGHLTRTELKLGEIALTLDSCSCVPGVSLGTAGPFRVVTTAMLVNTHHTTLSLVILYYQIWQPFRIFRGVLPFTIDVCQYWRSKYVNEQ